MQNNKQNGSGRKLFDQDAASTQYKGEKHIYTQHRAPSSGQRAQGQAPRQSGQPSSSKRQATRPRNTGQQESVRYSSGQDTPQRRPAGVRQTRASATRQTVPGKRQSVRKRKKRRNGCVIALLLVAVLLTGIIGGYTLLQKRLDGESGPAGKLDDEFKTPTYNGKKIVNFLLAGIGYDSDDGESYTSDDRIGPTDMILYVHYDTTLNKATLLQIPRDVYVGTNRSTGNSTKINALYPHAKDTNNRMNALAGVLYEQYGLPVDWYATIDLDALVDLVDVKGTIHMYVPMDVADPDVPTSVIEEGWRYLTGDQVRFLLRNRHSPTYNDQNDIARLRMQQSFYSALFREFKTLSAKDLVMWLDVLTYRCKIGGISMADLAGLGVKALGLESANITLARPSVGITEFSGEYMTESVVTLIPDEFADLLNTYLRPEGDAVPVTQLDIPTLQFDRTVYYVPEEVRTMADIQAAEPAPTAA